MFNLTDQEIINLLNLLSTMEPGTELYQNVTEQLNTLYQDATEQLNTSYQLKIEWFENEGKNTIEEL